MRQSFLWICAAGLAASAAACINNEAPTSVEQSSKATQQVAAKTEDGVTVYGTPYFGDLDASTPMVLLFHQGGSNGRGEYAGVAAWLNENGFRAIAWDLRAGGAAHGETNLTKAALSEGTPAGFCDAYPDLQTALAATTAVFSEKTVVWGSSYSAALVFRLAAENPGSVKGVIAFSPASGGPMADCRARMWVEDVTAPIFVLRPSSEMARDSSLEQRDILTAAGADFLVVENGVHGSSMLADERTDADMSAARMKVLTWLKAATGQSG